MRARYVPEKARSFLYLLLLLFSLLGMKSYGQTYLTWDYQVGCTDFYNDQRKDLMEEISDAPCVRVCENSTVTYSVSTSETITDIQWMVVGGTLNSTSGYSANVTWAEVGSGSLHIHIEFGDGTILDRDICFEIMNGPRALFGIAPTPGSTHTVQYEACVNQELYFNNISTQGLGSDIISYYWDFGDGTTSSAFEPVHAYVHDGEYQVSLTVTNACGCKHTFKVRVRVKYEAYSISCPSVVCEKERATYSVPFDPSAEGCENPWSVTGGTVLSTAANQSSITVEWNNVGPGGFGIVTFNGNNGCHIECRLPVTIKVPVIQSIGTIAGDATVCAKGQYHFSLPQWPTTEFHWSILNNSGSNDLLISDQRNETILNALEPGIVKLHCDYYNTLLHCGGKADLTITIKAPSIISGDEYVCVPKTEEYQWLDDDGSPLSGEWFLVDPTGDIISGYGSTFSATFTEAGTYVLYVQGIAACPAKPLTIHALPEAPAPGSIAGNAVICPSEPQTYSVTNSDPEFVAVWSVTGGTILGSNYGNQISVAFNPTGPYSVSVHMEGVAEPHCSSAPVMLSVEPLNLALTITQVTNSSPVCGSSYADYSVNYNEGETYEWTITPESAGSISSGADSNAITVNWNQPTGATASATLSLVVRQCGLEFHPMDVPITITSTPSISITASNQTVCRGESVVFNVVGLTSGSAVWDFGDGSSSQPTSVNSSVTHQYNQLSTANANHTVSVVVNGPNGCLLPTTATYIVTVIPAPVATITPSNTQLVCGIENALPLTVNVESGYGVTTTIDWFEVGNSTSIQAGGATNTTYVPDHFGSFFATITNQAGCHTNTIPVNIVAFCDEGGCSVEATVEVEGHLTGCFSVAATSSITGVTPDFVTWSLTENASISGGMNSATGMVTHPGSYHVFFNAHYLIGGIDCIVSDEDEFIVPYEADLVYDVSCGSNGNYDVVLHDQSEHYPSTPIDVYTFSVDGSVVQTGSLTDTPALSIAPGSHTLTIQIQNTSQLQDNGDPYPACSKTINLDLPALPLASINADVTTVCVGEPVHFSTPTNGVSYNWNISLGGIPIVNLQQNPIISFTQAGVYSVQLIIENEYGCQDSNFISNMITVKSINVNGSIIPLNDVKCEGSPITFSYLPNFLTEPGSSFQWMSGTTPIVGANSSSFTTYIPGLYWVHVEGANSCGRDINTLPGVAKFITPPAISLNGPDSICANDSFVIKSTGGGPGITYQWFLDGNPIPGGGAQSNTQNLATPGIHTYMLVAEITVNGVSCSSSASHEIEVFPEAIAPIVNFNIDCNGYIVYMDVTNPQPGNYTWSSGDFGPSVVIPGGGGAYEVYYTNGAGCSTSTLVQVPRNPEEYIWIFPRGCYSFCDTDDLTLIGPWPTMNHWDWVHDSTADSSGDHTHMEDYTITAGGNYQMNLSNGYCNFLSEPMQVSLDACTLCERLDVQVTSLYPKFDEKGNCYYVIKFDITNAYGYTVTASLYDSLGNGVFNPPTLAILPGTNSYQVEMYPTITTAFSMSMTFDIVLEDGRHCTLKKEIHFPGCENSARLTQANAVSKTLLQLVPNPASDSVGIFYTFGETGPADLMEIRLFDLTGRPLAKMQVNEASGQVLLPLQRLPAGMYFVNLVRNGQIVKTNRLLKE